MHQAYSFAQGGKNFKPAGNTEGWKHVDSLCISLKIRHSGTARQYSGIGMMPADALLHSCVSTVPLQIP